MPSIISTAVAIGILSLVMIAQPGCGRKSEDDLHSGSKMEPGSSGKYGEHDLNSESKMEPGSPQWNKAAAEDISLRIVAVLQRPAPRLSWFDEDAPLGLTREEKEAIATNGVTGQMEAVAAVGRGSPSREVRVIIIQSAPLNTNARLPVPENGSAIYIEKDGTLVPLFTNFSRSSLTLEVYQETNATTYFMDYPRDRVRAGGTLFTWDKNGKWHEL